MEDVIQGSVLPSVNEIESFEMEGVEPETKEEQIKDKEGEAISQLFRELGIEETPQRMELVACILKGMK